MGGKESKLCCITYEDAVKRVTDAELKRLRDAFKRASTLSGIMNKQAFIREVLGEGVPQKLAEHIYLAFGGTQKGIAFKDLLCGLVLLTRGRTEEKIKFIFGLFANDTGTHVLKDDMVKLVQACDGGFIPEAVADCFIETEKVTYDEFRDWLIQHSGATTLTRWLLQDPCTVTLSNDTETPTFYQTLAGVTHLEETDIIELEKRYWMLKAQSKSGKFDLETLIPLISPPIPLTLCEGIFSAFDENRDNHIDFKEMACGISACCRGPLIERQKFCFKIFDKDRDGQLSQEELLNMAEVLLVVRKENRSPEELENDVFENMQPLMVVAAILEEYDHNKDGYITLDGYLVWTVGHPLPFDFLKLLFQVCHIVLGLKPLTKEEEGEIIKGWLDREERRGLQLGQTWYLIAMQWWKAWNDYVSYQPSSIPPENDHSNMNGNNIVYNAGSLKRTKLQKKTANLSKTVTRAWDEPNVVITNVTLMQDCINDSTESMKWINNLTGSPKKNAFVSCNGEKSSSATPSPSQSPKLGRGISPSFQPVVPQRPPAIDNTPLIIPNTQKVMMLTVEGGKLKRNIFLARGQDLELVPEPVWKALLQWYGGTPALPRQVIMPTSRDISELELYPICLRLLRHQAPTVRTVSAGWTASSGLAPPTPAYPKRYLAYMASFSRQQTLKQVYDFLCTRLRLRPEDMRLWHYKDENNMTLLEEEDFTLEELRIEDNEQILIEVRNKDLTWPEEMSSLAANKNKLDRKRQIPTEKGATGLNNLGNTCFMNSALQCVSNTQPLTQYFTSNMHLYELNRSNPLGMKGHIAKRYGDLVQDLWSGTSKTIAPLKLRWTIGKYAPRFNGFQQHDSQELLAFLLDGLHEDLNRVHDKPYIELKDSDGRPDEIVAEEAWENHILRNKSIIVDLFHGQLKSLVRCKQCNHISVKFDPFNFLSLPLPMESCIHLEIIVIRLDGTIPVKYGLRLNMDEKYKGLKQQLSENCNIPPEEILLVEIFGALIKSIPADDQKIKTLLGGTLCAYEIPPPVQEEQPRSREPQTLNQIQRLGLTKNMEESSRFHLSRDFTGSLALSQDTELCRLHDNVESNSSQVSDNSSNRAQKLNFGRQSSAPVTKSTPIRPEPVKQSISEPAGNVSKTLLNSSLGLSTNIEMVQAHNRNPSSISNISINSQNNLGTLSNLMVSFLGDSFKGFVVAVHRKMIRMDVYFLSSQKSRPSLFGTPLILPCNDFTTKQDLYASVWTQVSRLVSPLPPTESNVSNHAQDCDDSLGYEYPFTLKAVQMDGITCAWCPWYRFCRGCKIDCCDEEFGVGSQFLAVDWDPTALHLRYQTSQERICIEHSSVENSRRLQTEPIDLDTCLKAFTKEEELGEDELYYCSKCKEHRLASKKLDLWRLPPILIIHLKRFQFVNGRWVKSQKIVNFPMKNFDPSNYLASPHKHVDEHCKEGTSRTLQTVNPSFSSTSHFHPSEKGDIGHSHNSSEKQSSHSLKTLQSSRQDITSLTDVKPTQNCNLSQDHVFMQNGKAIQEIKRNCQENDVKYKGKPVQYRKLTVNYKDTVLNIHQHLLRSKVDPTDLKYHLYAISCHSGILGGGHYVSYAYNPNGKWYCYNDSSCKEVTEDQIDSDLAYILFYERQGIDYEAYMPDITGKFPDTSEINDEFESDFKKVCCLQ